MLGLHCCSMPAQERIYCTAGNILVLQGSKQFDSITGAVEDIARMAVGELIIPKSHDTGSR